MSQSIQALLVLCLLALFLPTLAPTPVLGEDEAPAPPPRRGGSAWERIRAWDKDGDGTVTRDEFQGPDRVWSRLDADGNGRITREEAEKAGQGRRRGEGQSGRGRDGARGRGEVGAAAGGLLLEHVDADRDGKVSQTEWTAFFQALDENADGVVDAKEWKKALSPPTRPGGKAPEVGAKAPAVKAVPLGGGAAVDLGAPKRVTVLVFGSWT